MDRYRRSNVDLVGVTLHRMIPSQNHRLQLPGQWRGLVQCQWEPGRRQPELQGES